MHADHAIVMTEFDHRRLEQLCDLLRARGGVHARTLRALEDELEGADVVAPRAVPAGVVTMNSEVLVTDVDTREPRTVKLVFPGTAHIDSDRVSVLAPLGLALLGAREHEEVQWPTPGGMRRLRVERVLYQPEASGHFEL